MSLDKRITEKKGRGLIVFSDPAGAKACMAFAWLLREQNPEVEFQLVSNKSYDFYSDWDLSVEVTADPDSLPLGDIRWMFSGTSHPDSSGQFEMKLVKRALAEGIYTEAFIDHRTHLSLRFRLGEETILPDRILMIANELIARAVAEGLPEQKLSVIQNPYLHYIAHHWKSKLGEQEFRTEYHIPASVETIVVYAPDPLSLRKDAFNFKFDEFSVLRELLAMVQNSKKHFLIIRTHPLQELALMRSILEENEYRNACLDAKHRVENLELMRHSDIIIGFYSNFLLEAHALGKTIYRYFPDKNDPFETAFGNSTALFRSQAALAEALNL
jgi:hypothetical protein